MTEPERENVTVRRVQPEELATPIPSASPAPPRQRMGCWVVPCVLASTALLPGIYLASHWSIHGLLVHVITLGLLGSGSAVAAGMIAVAAFVHAMRRLGRSLQRDGATLVHTAKYMINMDPRAPLYPPENPPAEDDAPPPQEGEST